VSRVDNVSTVVQRVVVDERPSGLELAGVRDYARDGDGETRIDQRTPIAKVAGVGDIKTTTVDKCSGVGNSSYIGCVQRPGIEERSGVEQSTIGDFKRAGIDQRPGVEGRGVRLRVAAGVGEHTVVENVALASEERTGIHECIIVLDNGCPDVEATGIDDRTVIG
jgi:hypothetical protein